MPSEVIRCSDCGTPFKGIPTWLTTAKVKFTCTNCPRKPSRAAARFEPAPIVSAVAVTESDTDLEAIEIEEVEDSDLDMSLDDLDEPKDDKDL